MNKPAMLFQLPASAVYQIYLFRTDTSAAIIMLKKSVKVRRIVFENFLYPAQEPACQCPVDDPVVVT